MPRTRSIKPAFFVNEDLAALSPLARLFFIGLWCWADRDGRLENRPARLRVAILPYEEQVQVDAILLQLHDAGFALRYEVGAMSLLWIPNFRKHQSQSLHPKEARSIFPPHPDDAGGAQVASNSFPSLPSCTSFPSDSPLPPRGGFEKFWEIYPRKVNKQKAIIAWNKIAPDPVLLEKIIQAVSVAKQAEDWTKEQGRFIPHPTTWLNGHRWEDDLSPPENHSSADETIRRTMELRRQREEALRPRPSVDLFQEPKEGQQNEVG